MDRERFEKANYILNQIEELKRQISYLEIFDGGGITLYHSSKVNENDENRSGIYLDCKSIRAVVDIKKKEIDELEKQFKEL